MSSQTNFTINNRIDKINTRIFSRRQFITAGAVGLGALTLATTTAGCSGTGNAGTGAGGPKTLYLGTQNDYPPFTFVDTDGELNGFDIEFIRNLDERLTDYTIEIQPLGWDNSFVALDAGRIDMIVDQVAVNAEREETYLFSEPYFIAESVIIVKKGNPENIHTLTDLIGKRVRNPAGDSYYGILERWNNEHGLDEQIDIVDTPVSGNQPFLDVANGAAVAHVNDPIMAAATIKELGLDLEITGESLLSDPIAVLLPKNAHSEELKAPIDAAIAELKADGTLEQLSVKWTEGDYIPR